MLLESESGNLNDICLHAGHTHMVQHRCYFLLTTPHPEGRSRQKKNPAWCVSGRRGHRQTRLDCMTGGSTIDVLNCTSLKSQTETSTAREYERCRRTSSASSRPARATLPKSIAFGRRGCRPREGKSHSPKLARRQVALAASDGSASVRLQYIVTKDTDIALERPICSILLRCVGNRDASAS